MNNNFVSKKYSSLLVWPSLIIFSFFFVIPNIAGLVLGFTDWSAYNMRDPRFIGLDNFIGIFSDSIFLLSLKNTFYFSLVSTLFKLTIGMILALVLNKKLKFTNLYRTVIFAPIVINPIIVAIVFKAILQTTKGTLNVFLTSAGLSNLALPWLADPKIAMNSIIAVDIWMWSGLSMVIFLAAMQSVPAEYYEASRIDGANPCQQFRHVTLPLIFQSVTINVFLNAIGSLKVFALVYGLTNGGPADSTQVYGTFLYSTFSNSLFGYAASAGLVFTVVVSLLGYVLLGFFRSKEVEF